MQTSCPISTISFNTPEFLHRTLERLRVEARVISDWYYIYHKPEDDECANKSHCHVYIVPSSRLNTDDLGREFWEFDPEMPSKPRKCIAWHKSSTFADWYMYAIHDKSYLASKGQSRRYHYFYDDVIASDYDNLYYEVNSIDLTELTPYHAILDAIHSGIDWEHFFMRGGVPISQFSSYKAAFELLQANITYRNGRKGHE